MPRLRYLGDCQRPRSLVFVTVLIAIMMIPLPSLAAAPIAERDFEEDNWSEDLVDLRSIDLARTGIVKRGHSGRGLTVRIPEGGFRGFGPFDRFPLPEPTEAWYRYQVRLLSWNSASSGKLPGLSGIYSHTAKGCMPSEPGSPGWSARGLFGAAGTQGAPTGHVPIGTYLYHLDQSASCGDALYWPGAYLEPGRWQCVEGYVRLNTPGLNDGAVRAWLDGEAVFSRNGLAMRRSDEIHVGIREMWLNVYFGGRWPTPNDLSLILDEVAVSTEGRIGCLDPFTDDNQNIHDDSLTELHALGFLYGCDYRKVCPDRHLTRAEMAGLFSRVLDLPTADKDFFVDDTESSFEGDINRVAAAGISKGCNPPYNNSYCPDDPLTRAEFAAMATRALRLSPSDKDPFDDDEGHWAELDINAFAEAGITRGCGEKRFCPNDEVTRAEAATFLVRMIEIRAKGFNLSSKAPPPDWPPSGEPPPIPPEERD